MRIGRRPAAERGLRMPEFRLLTASLRSLVPARAFSLRRMSGYSFGKLTESKALTRIVFLETVAGVPGSVASTLRHLASLRRMKRDGGWINSLMSEAENERMHVSHTETAAHSCQREQGWSSQSQQTAARVRRAAVRRRGSRSLTSLFLSSSGCGRGLYFSFSC